MLELPQDGFRWFIQSLSSDLAAHWFAGSEAKSSLFMRETLVLEKSEISQIGKIDNIFNDWTLVRLIWGCHGNLFKDSHVPDKLEYLMTWNCICRILIYRRYSTIVGLGILSHFSWVLLLSTDTTLEFWFDLSDVYHPSNNANETALTSIVNSRLCNPLLSKQKLGDPLLRNIL